jgi:hypothetical protein
MFKKSEIYKLKKSLPSDGIKRISEEGDISKVTVYKFLNGDNVKDSSAEKIWITGWEVVKSHHDKLERLKALMNE